MVLASHTPRNGFHTQRDDASTKIPVSSERKERTVAQWITSQIKRLSESVRWFKYWWTADMCILSHDQFDPASHAQAWPGRESSHDSFSSAPHNERLWATLTPTDTAVGLQPRFKTYFSLLQKYPPNQIFPISLYNCNLSYKLARVLNVNV